MRLRRVDVMVGIVLFLLIGTIAIAQINFTTETEARVKCAANLRLMGQALLLYSNDNRGAYPRTVADINNPKPTWGTPYEGNEEAGPEQPELADPFDAKKSQALPKPNDVTAALFLLLRTQDITGNVFTCPSTGSEPFDFGGKPTTALNWTNWPGNSGLAQHLSYSYQNPYPTKDAVANGFKLNNAIGQEFAVAADMNPGLDALTKVPLEAGADAIRVGNSANHGGDGQNVLFGDGHIEWLGSPYVGVQKDNIYTFGDSGSQHPKKAGEGIVGSSVGASDSVLLPTAKDIGVLDAAGKMTEAAKNRRARPAPETKPGTADERAAMAKRIVGNYVSDQGARSIALKVTPDTLVATTGPITITYGYAVDAIGAGGAAVAHVQLTAPDTPASRAVIHIDAAGALTIRGSRYFDGTWKKQ